MTDWRQGPNAEQIEHWNADEAQHWVKEADRYDAMLRPLGELAMERAALAADERVLDVGCGGGQTTIAIAGRVGPDGAVTGIDISEPLVRRAREAAAHAGVSNVEFELGDAQTHPFAADTFDAVFSRFGVMFFADPAAAFANLARALRGDGRIAFVCWREFEAQEWLMVPGAAALAYVPMPDLGQPGAPGMFALADADRTRAVLGAAGFTGIEIEARDVSLTLAGGGTLDEVMRFLDGSPVVDTLLEDADEDSARSALAAIRKSFEPYATPDGVVLGAGVWIVTARRGG
jgi:SAM-dependent methyltransferase